MSNKVSPLQLIDQLIMLIQLLKLQAIRIILIQHLERQSCLLISDLLRHLLQHRLELIDCEVALPLWVEIVEDSLQG